MSNSATLTRDEAPTRDHAWRPMASCPRDGLVLLKTPIEGGHWPVVGRFSFVHGGFCSLAILGQTEQQLFPVAWTAIPPYDNGAHV
jgi:hypothetical protein